MADQPATADELEAWRSGEPVPRSRWDAARRVGWRGTVGGWPVQRSLPPDVAHQRDQFAIEEAMRAWGWPVVGMTQYSTRGSRTDSDGQRTTTVVLTLDADGEFIDRRMPIGGAGPARAVMIVCLVARPSSQGLYPEEWTASIHICSTKNHRLLDAASTASPLTDEHGWAQSPYGAVHGALVTVSDHHRRLRAFERPAESGPGTAARAELDAPRGPAADADEPTDDAGAPAEAHEADGADGAHGAHGADGASGGTAARRESPETPVGRPSGEWTPEQRLAYDQARQDRLFADLEDVPASDDDGAFDELLDQIDAASEEPNVAPTDDVPDSGPGWSAGDGSLETVLVPVHDAVARVDDLRRRLDEGGSVLNPEALAALVRELRNAEANLSDLVAALDERADAFADHHLNMVTSTEVATDSLVRAQQAKMVQDYLLRLGSILADLASISNGLGEFQEKLTKLKPSDGLLRDGDAVYEFLKDYESLVNTAVEGLDWDFESHVFNDIGALVPTADSFYAEHGANPMLELQTVKSHLSDITGIIAEACDESGKFDPDKLLTDLKTPGQLITRVLKSYAEWEQQLRAQQIADLDAAIAAEQGVYGETFSGMLAANEDRFVAADALEAVSTARLALLRSLGTQAPWAITVGAVDLAPPGASLVDIVRATASGDIAARADAVQTGRTGDDLAPLTDGSCVECAEAAHRLRSAIEHRDRTEVLTPNDSDAVLAARDAVAEATWQFDLCRRLLCAPPLGSEDTDGTTAVLDDPMAPVIDEFAGDRSTACPACERLVDELRWIDDRAWAIERRLAELAAVEASVERLRRAYERAQQRLADISSQVRGVQQDRENPLIFPLWRGLDERETNLQREYQATARQVDEIRQQIDQLIRSLDEAPILRAQRGELAARGYFVEGLLRMCEETRCGDRGAALADAIDAAPSVPRDPPDLEQTEPFDLDGPPAAPHRTIFGFPWWVFPLGFVLLVFGVVLAIGLTRSGGSTDEAVPPAQPEEATDGDAQAPPPGDPIEDRPSADPAPDSGADAPSADVEAPPDDADAPAVEEDDPWRSGLLLGASDARPGVVGVDPEAGESYSILGTPGAYDPASAIDGFDASLVAFTDAVMRQVAGNTSYPCGADNGDYRVTCARGAGTLAAGEYFVVGVRHDGPVAAGEGAYTYGLAFDDDGDESDNYNFFPPYDGDFFRNTEHWYRLQIDRDGTRRMYADGYRNGIPGYPRASSAFVIESEDLLVWVVPRDELDGPSPAFRASAFHNRGESDLEFDPATSGGDITGTAATDPLVEIPLGAVIVDDVSGLPPDVEGTTERRAIVDPPDVHITRVLLEEFVTRANVAFGSGNPVDVDSLLIPGLLEGPAAESCRATVDSSIGQATGITLVDPGGAPMESGVLLYQPMVEVEYPTGAVAWQPFLAVGPDGRLGLVLAECLG